jgi:hypothetical protein
MSALRRDGLVNVTAVVCARRAAVLIEDLRDAHRWLDELLCDSRLTWRVGLPGNAQGDQKEPIYRASS